MSVEPAIQSTFSLTVPEGAAEAAVLTNDARQFLIALANRFEGRRQEILEARRQRLAQLHAGATLDFLPETAPIRNADWKVAPIPDDLQDRRVEITGPVDRKMIINALNSGANVFMADFEDSNSPTWDNNIQGQINLYDANARTITFTSPEGKTYKLNDKVATLLVRPRGWHLVEKHVLIDGAPISASLFDFGLYFFHNVRVLLDRGSAPYFYLPKMEGHREARLWNDVFVFAQEALGVPQGTIRATVLIETIPAAFEMDEILYELRDHSAGLNCGRWDYIFSFIKKFSHRPDWVLPDRAQVTMEKHFLASYVKLLIQTCHRRGIHAMGGMAAQIPIKSDPEANNRAIAKVQADKLREVLAGHDGTWVAHPGLIATAKAVFDEHMPTANQINVPRPPVDVTAADLLKLPEGEITQAGLEMNIDVGLQYLEAWLKGNGCVPIYNLMEDAATAEISRAQLWQWAHHGARMSDGRQLSVDAVIATIPKVLDNLRARIGDEAYQASQFPLAARLFEEMTRADTFPEFLTLAAYEHID
ncbi:MAG: malate synthase A [Bryobacterales bacterium]|nr:malate synthase A [Bryobacterales bacterium]